MFLIFLFQATIGMARPLTTEDFAKVYSRNTTTPLARQGTCLAFAYANSHYCLSSYHVAYGGLLDGYDQTASFEDGQSGKLKWVAGDWGRGFVLLEFTEAPNRKYIHWSEIQWHKDLPLKKSDVVAWGYPLGSRVLNQAFGSVSTAEAKKFPFFVYIDEYIFVEDIATEIGFSGGGLISETGDYLGLLSHQVIVNQKVMTIAIPAKEVFDWADRHLDPLVIENNSFFFVDPEQIDLSYYNLYMKGMSLSVGSNQNTNPFLFLRIGPNPYENLVHANWRLARMPGLFPKEVPSGIGGDGFHLNTYYYVGATPYWPIFSMSEAKLFSTGAEVLKFWTRPDMFDDTAGVYHFLNTGSVGARLTDRQHDLLNLWEKTIPVLEKVAGPVWREKWMGRLGFINSHQEFYFYPINGCSVCLIKLSRLQELIESPEIQKDRLELQRLFPNELHSLELALSEVIRLHRLAVVVISASQLIDSRK